MNTIDQTQEDFQKGKIDKPTFIRTMFEQHHAKLFYFSTYLSKTNIKEIIIEDNQVVMVTRDRGMKMLCPPGDFRVAPIETLNFFDYEKSDSDMIERLIKDGDVFFDIGANMGWYSINIALSRRNCQVHCFEPIPKTYQCLQNNININAVNNIHAHNFGLSDKSGHFDFYYYTEGSGNASSANVTGREDVEVCQCQVRTLDDFIAELPTKIDFIKCDVEGAELLAFRGGREAIAKNLPIVFSEILRKWSAKFNYDPNDIFDFFRQLGYQAFTAENERLIPFHKMDESTVETNFFFLHKEKNINIITTLCG